MSLYIGNKKYAVIKTAGINNTDILITENGNYTPGDDYTGFELVRVQVPESTFEDLIVDPTTTTTTYTSTNYDGYSSVTVNAVTSSIDSNISSENIASGVTILGVTGTLEFVTEDLTITPSTSSQIFTSTDYDGYGTVTCLPVTYTIDSNISSGNILEGVTILGVTGTVVESNETTRDIVENGTYTPDDPYTGFSQVVVDVPAVQTALTVTPSTTQQVFTASDVYSGYTPVTVEAVTSSIDSNILASNILEGVTILGVTGTVVELSSTTLNVTENGTYTPSDPYNAYSTVTVDVVPDITSLSITPSTSAQTFTAADDYSGYSPVTVSAVTSSIDSNIIAANIVSGITILGVTGTATELSATTLSVTENGTYTPSSPYNAYTSVTVDINTVNNTTITITSNGTYTPSDDYTGFSSVTVDIDTVNNTDLSVTENGTYTPSGDYTGFGTVVVDVDTVNNTTLTVTENGTYTPSSAYTGYSSVTVNVETEPTLQDITITEAGTYTCDSGYDGFGTVTVDLSWIEEALEALNAGDEDSVEVTLQDITITEAGTYTCDSGYDGFGTVTVDLSWVDTALENASATSSTLDEFVAGTATSITTDAETVKDYCFYYQEELTTVVLNEATYIGQYAFGNTNVTSLTIRSETVCTLTSTNALEDCPIESGAGYIYVPSDLLEDYQSATNWSIYADYIQAIE